jgi:hypothetical protein
LKLEQLLQRGLQTYLLSLKASTSKTLTNHAKQITSPTQIDGGGLT